MSELSELSKTTELSSEHEPATKPQPSLHVEMLMNGSKRKVNKTATAPDDAALLISLRNRFRSLETNVMASHKIRSNYPEFLKRLDVTLKSLLSEYQESA